MADFECVIVGGGPAGLTAALVLGRARRSVLLIDEEKPRNRITQESHGYLTRDGIKPFELRRIAREEIANYPSVHFSAGRVTAIDKKQDGFSLRLSNGQKLSSKKILLATGVKDTLPDIEHIKEYYGKSLFSCPYCDGWEQRDLPLVIIAGGEKAFHLAKIVYQWSQDLVVCTNGSSELTPEQVEILGKKNINVVGKEIQSLEGHNGKLEKLLFKDGSELMRKGGFVAPELGHAADLHKQLGCELNEIGAIITDNMGRTNVPGVFAAGDAITIGQAQLSIAAASGNKAAAGVNAELTEALFAN